MAEEEVKVKVNQSALIYCKSVVLADKNICMRFYDDKKNKFGMDESGDAYVLIFADDALFPAKTSDVEKFKQYANLNKDPKFPAFAERAYGNFKTRVGGALKNGSQSKFVTIFEINSDIGYTFDYGNECLPKAGRRKWTDYKINELCAEDRDKISVAEVIQLVAKQVETW